MRSDGLGDRGFVEAIGGQGLPHLLKRLGQLGRAKASAGLELAGSLQLRIQCGAFGSIHCDGSNERAWRSLENEGHSVLIGRSFNPDGVKEAGGKELAQAL